MSEKEDREWQRIREEGYEDNTKYPEERISRKAIDLQPETVRRLGLRPNYDLDIGV